LSDNSIGAAHKVVVTATEQYTDPLGAGIRIHADCIRTGLPGDTRGESAPADADVVPDLAARDDQTLLAYREMVSDLTGGADRPLPVGVDIDNGIVVEIIDPPIEVDGSWPAADRAVIDRATSSPDILAATPLVWTRVRVPGTSHVWHRCVWMKVEIPQGTYIDYRCECDRDHGRHCGYRTAAARVRAATMKLEPEQLELPSHLLRNLLERALAGDWIGQSHASDFWGSNLYFQTICDITGWHMGETANHAYKARDEGLIGLEGWVLTRPRAPRAVPDGPLMDWESTECTDPGGWVVWWSRLDHKFQVEVVHTTTEDARAGRLTIYDRTTREIIHTSEVEITAGASFGADAADVATWQQRAIAAVDHHGESTE
jgi:hypothetical protein